MTPVCSTFPSNHSAKQNGDQPSPFYGHGIKLSHSPINSGEAEKAGLKIPPTKLLIYASPKAGTPLMLTSPSVAIDLPLKPLVWEECNLSV